MIEADGRPRVSATHSTRLWAWMLQAALAAAGMVALSWPALENGYPLVHQDSAWYLATVHGAEAHSARTLGYSFLAGLALSLQTHWAIVFLQSLVTSSLLVRCGWVAATGASAAMRAGLAAAGLGAVVLLSGGPKYASWLMADIMTPWLFLAGLLWMRSSRLADRALALAAGWLAIAGHNSHLPIAFGMAAFVLAGSFAAAGPMVRRRAAGLLAMVLLSYPVIAIASARSGEEAGALRGTTGFLLYSLSDSGVLSETLDAYCEERHWVSCRYRAEVLSHVGQGRSWLLFDPASPFYRAGGWGNGEARELIAHALRCCWPSVVRTTLAGAWRQLWSIDSRDGLEPRNALLMEEYLEKLATKRLPLSSAAPVELEQLRNGRQARDGRPRVLLHPLPEPALQAFLLMAAAGLAAFSWSRGVREPALLLGALVAFLLLNALVCAIGSSVFGRYQGRVAWLLPWALVIAGGRVAAQLVRGSRFS